MLLPKCNALSMTFFGRVYSSDNCETQECEKGNQDNDSFKFCTHQVIFITKLLAAVVVIFVRV